MTAYSAHLADAYLQSGKKQMSRYGLSVLLKLPTVELGNARI